MNRLSHLSDLGFLLQALFFLSLCVLHSKPAHAQSAHGPDRGHAVEAEPLEKRDHCTVELLVLHATNTNRGIDPRIGDMPELKKPPFSAYSSYSLLEKKHVKLKVGSADRRKLPNGRTLETKLIESLPNDFVRLSASINQPKGKEFLPLLEVKAKLGQKFVVAGQSYKNGILVLVFRVLPKS